MTNPFKEVSTYPPSTPMIGQTRVRGLLEHFLERLSESPSVSFMALFGDWGMGKTRVANEVIAEVVGQGLGWLCEEDGLYDRTDLVSPEDTGKILPLMIKFDDAVRFRPTKDDIFWWCLHRALVNLNTGDDIRDRSLQAFLREMDPTLMKKLNMTLAATNTREEAISQSKAAVDLIMDSTIVERLLVIVDEIESIGEQTDMMPEHEAKGQERDLLRELFSGIKDQVNINPDSRLKIENVGFLLLCSEGVRDIEQETRRGALERRYYRGSLNLPTLSDMKELLRSIETNHPDIKDLGRRIFESAFFAADRNLGWFMSISAALLRESRISEETDKIVLMKQVSRKIGQVFLQDGIPSLENDVSIDPEDRKLIVPILLSLLPTPIQELQLSREQAERLTRVKDSFGSKILGILHPFDGFPSALVKLLIDEAGYEEGEPHEDMRTIASRDYVLRPLEMEESLSVFTDDRGRQLLFADRDDLFTQLRYYYDPTMPESVAGDIYSIIASRKHDAANTYLAPTVGFLTKFLKHVRSRSIRRRWLSTTRIWEESTSKLYEIQESHSRTMQAVCVGLAKMLYPNSKVDDDDRYRSTCVVVHLSRADRFAVSSTDELFIVFHSTSSKTTDDLTRFARRSKGRLSDVVAIVVFDDASKQEEVEEAIIGSSLESSDAIVIGLVLKGGIEQEFLIRYSLMGADGFPFQDLSNQGRRIRDEFSRMWSDNIEAKKEQMIMKGSLLMPLYYPTRAYSLEDLIDAYQQVLKGSKHPIDFTPSTTKSKSQTDMDKKKIKMKQALEDSREKCTSPSLPVLTLFDESYKVIFPSQFSYILGLIQSNSRTPKDLLPAVFLERSYEQTVPIVLRDTLLFLESLGLIFSDDKGLYQLCSRHHVSEQIGRALLRIESYRTHLEEKGVTTLGELGDFFQGALIGDLRITDSNIERISSELDAALKTAEQIDLDETSLKSITGLRKVVRILNKTHGIAEKVLNEDPDLLEGDLEELVDKLEEITADRKYERFTISERVSILDKIRDELGSDISHLEERIVAVIEELDSISSSFCPDPIRRVLSSIQNQMQWHEEKPIEEIRIEEEDNNSYSLLRLMKSGRIHDVANRISHYFSLLSDEESEIEMFEREVTEE